uniref:Methyl-CpG binding domain protein 1b n=1 Tax=Poecilia formosa TaxID=48698 RepID=A0A096M5K9_POEFO
EEAAGESKHPASEAVEEEEEDQGKPAGEPPMDWFEPLEDDDDDPDEESLAGETESIAGSERATRHLYQIYGYRRKRAHPEEGWVEWPVLGQGWKRKEVVRRSGSSIGQKDVYYLSPRGDRVRSRVELATVLQGTDLTQFEYKSGKFVEGEIPPVRGRPRTKLQRFAALPYVSETLSGPVLLRVQLDGQRRRGRDSGLSPPADPEHHTQEPPQQPDERLAEQLNGFITQLIHSLLIATGLPLRPKHQTEDFCHPVFIITRLIHSLLIATGLPLNFFLICAKCGTWYDKQRKRPCCPSCWATSKSIEHPLIRFRKLDCQWIPCGQCVGCHNAIDCGQCANCKHGLQSPEARKRLCRKRRCICPIRKKRSFVDPVDTYEDSVSLQRTIENVQNDVTESQHPSLKSSDTENFSANVDLDDDDMSTDDDDDWHKKRKRRSCGECKACLCRKDCGVCDFCIDKPKFGGSNKKRQKCRLRQCQRQAMRHLLPFQMAGAELGLDAPLLPGRPRPHYTYSRKSSLKRSQDQQADMDYNYNQSNNVHTKERVAASHPSQKGNPILLSFLFSWLSFNFCYCDKNMMLHNNLTIDNMSDGVLKNFSELTSITALHSGGCRQRKERQQDKDHHSQWDTEKSHTGRNAPKHMGDDEDEFPMITQIFSLAENPAESGVDLENQLMKLLHSLRSSVLPILWYAIMVEGPQLQLIQCSKQSNMADTMVLIDPGFCYQVTVQKQPLLPIHPLYDIHPSRLGTATDVVSLLLSLERYVVCQGLPIKQSSFDKGPIVLERSATCDFLIKKNEQTCASCKALQELQIHHRE